jgi:hypothetical protein
MTLNVAKLMGLETPDAKEAVGNRLQTLYQEYSLKIFSFTDAQIEDFL